MQAIIERPCFNCGRSWGGGRSCQWCRQVEGLPTGVRLSTAAKRFGAYLLDNYVLAIVTLGIGWLVWSLIIYKNGQTPAKQLLGMRYLILDKGAPAGWGRTFLREFIAKSLVGLLIGWLIFPFLWLLWDRDNQQLWDKVVGTIVVDDPNRQLATEAPRPFYGSQGALVPPQPGPSASANASD